jgi:hypothetical protein
MAQIMVGEPYHFCALNGSCYNDNDRRVTIEYNEYTPAEIVFQTELFQNTYPEFEIIEPTSIINYTNFNPVAALKNYQKRKLLWWKR